MKKSIKKNYIYNLTYQILILFIPVITTPILARTIGDSGAGVVSFVESIATYFIMIGTPGVAILGQREISYVQDDRKSRSEIFWSIKSLELITSVIALLAYVVFSSFQTKNQTIYFAFAFSILATVVDVSWFFQGIEEFGKIVFRNLIIKMLNIVYILIFVKTPSDAYKYAFGLAFFTFLANASLWGYIPKYVDAPNFMKIKPWNYIKSAIILFLPTIAIKVYTVLDKTMIGTITRSDAQNGNYEYATQASRLLLAVVTAIGTVMIPRIGYHFKRNEKDQIEILMYKSYRAVMLIAVPMCLGLVFVADKFIPWFLGPKLYRVADLLKILSMLFIAIGLSTVTGTQYMVPTMRQNKLTASVCVGAVVNFILNMFLISRYKANGAAIASVIAEFSVTFVQFIFVRKEISFLKVLKNSTKYILAGAFMSLGLFYESKIFSPNIISTLVMVASGGLIYVISLILLKDEFCMEQLLGLKNKVLSKIKK